VLYIQLQLFLSDTLSYLLIMIKRNEFHIEINYYHILGQYINIGILHSLYAIIKQKKHQAAYIPFMQSVPCLRISERLVRVSSDHNTRWTLPYSQKQITRKQSRDAALRRKGATSSFTRPPVKPLGEKS